MDQCARHSIWKVWAASVVLIAMALLYQPANAVTTLSVDDKTVVITVPIDVRGLRGNKAVNKATGEIFDAATYIEQEVERIWNEAFLGFSYECWTFRLDLKLFPLNYNEVTDKLTPGHHLIRIDPSSKHSYWNMTGPDDQCPHCDFPFAYSRDMTGVFNTPDPSVLSHEIGHAMGLGDDYFTKGGYKPEAAGVGHEAGVIFLNADGEEIERGSFMTRGAGRPEPIHLWRAVNVMKAGVLPPCPGKLWTGIVHWTAKHSPTHLVTSRATVKLRETQITDRSIELIHEGSAVTVTHSTLGADTCSYAGGGTSLAEGRAGWLEREQSTGPNGELRWGPWTYQLAITPAREPVWTQTCPDVAWPGTDRTHAVTYGGNASGSWLAYIGGLNDSDPGTPRLLDGGRMTGSYTSRGKQSWEDTVIWSICREDAACAPLPESASAPSTSDGGRQQAGAPPGGASPSPSGPVAAPPAQVSPALTPRVPRATGGGFIRP